MSTVPFSERAWSHVADRYADICRHPFVTGLADGTLPDQVFAGYLVDDAHYLAGYARALARIASRLDDFEDVGTWATLAAGAVAAERTLHLGELSRRGLDVDGRPPSPSCVAYLAMLVQHALDSPVEVAVAAVLPCFRVYVEVGRQVAAAAGGLDRHPYGRWIATYDSADFEASVRRAESTADRLAAGSTFEGSMLTAYAAATDLEWHFWDEAWRAGGQALTR